MQSSRSRRRWVSILASLGIFGALVLTLGELGLRVLGRAPRPRTPRVELESPLHAPHPRLGWVNRPQAHVLPSPTEGGAPIVINIEANGSRRSSEEPVEADSEVWFVGGSFTLGWAIPDQETLAWHVQRRLPGCRIENFGTAAYGTYQSLLLLEELLQKAEHPPEAVVYGFTEFHEVRNVATDGWLEFLSELSHRGHVAAPWVSLDANQALVYHAPRQWRPWIGERQLALVATTHRALSRLADREKIRSQRRATQLLMLEMHRMLSEHDVKLIVALLHVFDRSGLDDYLAFLDRAPFPAVDCVIPDSEHMVVPGDGHPNGELNLLWARGIVPVLATACSADSSVR